MLIDNKAYVNCKENIDIKMNKIIPPIPCLKSNQRQQDAIKMMHNIKWHNKTNYIITLIIAQETQTNRTRYKDKEIT